VQQIFRKPKGHKNHPLLSSKIERDVCRRGVKIIFLLGAATPHKPRAALVPAQAREAVAEKPAWGPACAAFLGRQTNRQLVLYTKNTGL
jgi:hypothetical protein